MSLSRFRVLEKLEKSLRIAAVLAFACFAVVHYSAAAEPYRFYWSFSDCLEEENVPADRAGTTEVARERTAKEETVGERTTGEGAAGEGTLRIELEEPDSRLRPVVKINDRVAAGFDRQEVVVRVRDGDLIAIDGLTGDRTLTFRITEASPGIAWPPPGYRIQTRASPVLLGRVKIDQASR